MTFIKKTKYRRVIYNFVCAGKATLITVSCFWIFVVIRYGSTLNCSLLDLEKFLYESTSSVDNSFNTRSLAPYILHLEIHFLTQCLGVFLFLN